MKTKFEKIYVISLISNRDRQEFIKHQFNDIGLEFEFIYGTDFYNLKKDGAGRTINYPTVWDEYDQTYDYSRDYGCTLSHYNGILFAYELGYNNVLIIEDDICFIKDKQLIEYYLNNIPNNIDFITFDPRFITDDEREKFTLKQSKSKSQWVKIDNTYETLIGGMMYGLMNRNIMKLYLDCQRELLRMSDRIIKIYAQSNIKRYTTNKCICVDQWNILCNLNVEGGYKNTYDKSKLTINDFYTPNQFNCFTK